MVMLRFSDLGRTYIEVVHVSILFRWNRINEHLDTFIDQFPFPLCLCQLFCPSRTLGVKENELRYPPNVFDLVILRETLMYLDREDKAVILRKIKQMLRREDTRNENLYTSENVGGISQDGDVYNK